MNPNIGKLMQQAKKLQADMEKAQKELETLEVVGESGGGLVKVCSNGRHDIKWVKLDPSLFSEDREVVEDLIAAAVNDAVRKVEKSSKSKMANLAAGIGLPLGLDVALGGAGKGEDE